MQRFKTLAAGLALFALLGENDPIVQKHRRAFNMALY